VGKLADQEKDVFISYARSDRAAVERIHVALENVGLSVWRDEQEIDEFETISPGLRRGLAGAKVLLAYYSQTYPTRRACQWELTTAVIAGEGEAAVGADIWDAVQRRVLVVNPLLTPDHIEPATLRHRRFYNLPNAADENALADLARKVQAHVDDIPSAMTIRPPAKPQRVGSVWQRPPNRFVGRLPEMWRIHAGLRGDTVLLTADGTAPGGGHGLAQVQAWGGMGKSLLAEEYGRRFEPAWPGGLFWLSAGGADASAAAWQGQVETQLIAVIIDLDDEVDLPELRRSLADEPTEMRIRLLRKRVGRLLKAREQLYLWVVDDLPHHMPTAALEAWGAPSPNGHTLFTTRDRGLSAVGQVIDLGVLDPDQALRLLTAARTPVGVEEEEAARQIVECLGRYPLAIDVAGQLAPAFADFAALLAVVSSPGEDEEILDCDLQGELPNGHESNIVATLRSSIHHAEVKDPLALAVLQIMAYLAPQAPIPVAVVEDMVGKGTRGAVELLHRLSLLDRADGEIAMHQIIARAVALDSPAETLAAAKAAVVGVLMQHMKAAIDIRQHKALMPLLPHVQALTATPDTAEETRLLLWLGLYYFEAGQAAQAEPLFRQCGRVLHRILGAEHPDTLTSMTNLAETLRAQGDHTGARALQEEVLEIERRILGAEHPATMTSMNNLAGTLWAQGDHAGARMLQEEALEVRLRILGAAHPDTLISMSNLAGTVWMQVDHAEARALQEEVLEFRRRILGAEHPATLISMSNLAATLWAQGDHAEARMLQEGVLEVRRRILGAEHPDTLTSMNNLAETLWAQGDHAGARVPQEEVLEARRRILGAEHPDTLTGMNNLALTLAVQGDHAGARELEEEVLEVRRRILGAEHPDTLSSMVILGVMLLKAKDVQGVFLLWEALKLHKRVMPDHPHTRELEAFIARHAGNNATPPD